MPNTENEQKRNTNISENSRSNNNRSRSSINKSTTRSIHRETNESASVINPIYTISKLRKRHHFQAGGRYVCQNFFKNEADALKAVENLYEDWNDVLKGMNIKSPKPFSMFQQVITKIYNSVEYEHLFLIEHKGRWCVEQNYDYGFEGGYVIDIEDMVHDCSGDEHFEHVLLLMIRSTSYYLGVRNYMDDDGERLWQETENYHDECDHHEKTGDDEGERQESWLNHKRSMLRIIGEMRFSKGAKYARKFERSALEYHVLESLVDELNPITQSQRKLYYWMHRALEGIKGKYSVHAAGVKCDSDGSIIGENGEIFLGELMCFMWTTEESHGMCFIEEMDERANSCGIQAPIMQNIRTMDSKFPILTKDFIEIAKIMSYGRR